MKHTLLITAILFALSCTKELSDELPEQPQQPQTLLIREFALMLEKGTGYQLSKVWTEQGQVGVPDTIADNVYEFDAAAGSDCYVFDFATSLKCKYSFRLFADDTGIVLNWIDYNRETVNYWLDGYEVGEWFRLKRIVNGELQYFLYLRYKN
jgi:hypothetical protein